VTPCIQNWIRNNEPSVYAEFFGDLAPIASTIEDRIKVAEGFDVAAYITRIKDALPKDPALAIGSTKELIESVLKTILSIHGANLSDEDIPKSLKRAQAALGIDPKDVDASIPGSESLRRLLGSLAQIVISVNELRNLYGTGHGRSNAAGLDLASTNLVVSAGINVASYMMERYRTLREQGSQF
ncbi:MAG: abortive infection family protein, partial [Nitrososphaera sp.]